MKLLDIMVTCNYYAINLHTHKIYILSGIGASQGFYNELEMVDASGKTYDFNMQNGTHAVFALGIGFEIILDSDSHFYVEIRSNTLFLPSEYFIFAPISVGMVF